VASLLRSQQSSGNVVGGELVGMARNFLDPCLEIAMEDLVDHVQIEAVVDNPVQCQHVVQDCITELCGVGLVVAVEIFRHLESKVVLHCYRVCHLWIKFEVNSVGVSFPVEVREQELFVLPGLVVFIASDFVD